MTPERKTLAGAPLLAPENSNVARGPNAKAFRAKARIHALAALEALATLAKSASSEAVRVSAANALLDRGYGKPISGAAARGAAPGRQTPSWSGGDVEVEWLDGQSL